MLAVFLDIETNGLDPKRHFPIDIAFMVTDISEYKVLAGYQSLICLNRADWEKSDPRSLRVNGYTWEMLLQGQTLEIVRHEILSLLSYYPLAKKQAVFICQNPTFDRAFFSQIIDVYTQEELGWPYHWLDLASMYWALRTKEWQQQHLPFPMSLSLSKNDIAAEYGLPMEPEPHQAIQGVEHLMRCYEAVLGISFLVPNMTKTS